MFKKLRLRPYHAFYTQLFSLLYFHLLPYYYHPLIIVKQGQVSLIFEKTLDTLIVGPLSFSLHSNCFQSHGVNGHLHLTASNSAIRSLRAKLHTQTSAYSQDNSTWISCRHHKLIMSQTEFILFPLSPFTNKFFRQWTLFR